MQFLYSNDGDRGLFSSLTGSWLFWIVIVLIIVMIIVSVISSNKELQKQLKIEKFFGNARATDDTTINRSDNIMDGIQQSVIDEINEGNLKMYNGVVPNRKKYIGDNLDNESAGHALLLGVSSTNKEVKQFYAPSSKQENIYKIDDDDDMEVVNFNLELRDLSKITYNPTLVSEVRIYSHEQRCLVVMTIDTKRIKIQSISPFFDDVVLPLDDAKRLLAFDQKSNKLFVGPLQVAAFDIYDKICYFVVNSPIIKELQYAIRE